MLPPLPEFAFPPWIVISARSAVTFELMTNPCEPVTWIVVKRAPAPEIEVFWLSVRAPSVSGYAPAPIEIASWPALALAAVTAARRVEQLNTPLPADGHEPVASGFGVDTT